MLLRTVTLERTKTIFSQEIIIIRRTNRKFYIGMVVAKINVTLEKSQFDNDWTQIIQPYIYIHHVIQIETAKICQHDRVKQFLPN